VLIVDCGQHSLTLLECDTWNLDAVIGICDVDKKRVANTIIRILLPDARGVRSPRRLYETVHCLEVAAPNIRHAPSRLGKLEALARYASPKPITNADTAEAEALEMCKCTCCV
jgi:hypothetical protein